MAKKQLSLTRLSFPIFWDLLSKYLTVIINTAMVSHYSNFLVGAMGAGNQILDLFITIFSFLSVGCSVLIAQAIGAKDHVLARKVIHQSLFLNALLGFVCGVLILWHGEYLLYLLKIPQELLKDSEIYLHMLAICLFFDAIGIVLAAIVRVYNMAYWVMFIGFLMDIVVICGNYYVLHYTKSELFGVGLSNIFARIVAIVALLVILFYKLKIHLKIKEMIKLEKEVLKKVLNIGGFSAGENLLWIVQYTIAFAFVASLGEASLSVQTIYFQISMLIMLIGQAISIANEIIVGKLIGARYENIAYKHAWRALYFSVVASALVALLNYLCQDFTMQILGLKEELKNLEELKPKLEEELKILLLPKDPNDERNIFLEIRAGTGGDEASLFVGDLVKAYARYAENRGYKLEIVSSSEGSVGGFKEIIMLVKGAGAFSRLKYEGGTHRVQRVPQTESQGRIHTSAITIAVMPEVDDIEIEINPNDLKIDLQDTGGKV